MKTIVVISGMVDSTIREYQPDVTFLLFHSIEELDKYIMTTPIRAESLFFTRDVIPQVNTSLTYLAQMLKNPFLRVDVVTYITEKNSAEIASIRYMIETQGYENWEIVESYLTREQISGIINGTLRTDNVSSKRKALYRVPRDAYIQEQLRRKGSLDEDYFEDERQYTDIPDEEPPVEILPERDATCDIIHIVGTDSNERTAFAFLVAQYMSLSGKTIIMERDIEYHRLTEFITKSNVECFFVDMTEFVNEPHRLIEAIKRAPQQLVCVGCIQRLDYSYTFMSNVIYNNCMHYTRFFIREDDFVEAPQMQEFHIVFPSTVIGILEACEQLNPIYINLMHFIGVDDQSYKETKIESTKQIETIIKDVLNVNQADVSLVNLRSLRIGSESNYDIRSVIRR